MENRYHTWTCGFKDSWLNQSSRHSFVFKVNLVFFNILLVIIKRSFISSVDTVGSTPRSNDKNFGATLVVKGQIDLKSY